MDKLKVSKEFSKALQCWLQSSKHDNQNEALLKNQYIAIHEGFKWTGIYESLNELSVSEMAQALYVGYEVEESKEEKLGKLFNNTKAQSNWEAFEVRIFMKNVLSAVDINVPNDYWKDLL